MLFGCQKSVPNGPNVMLLGHGGAGFDLTNAKFPINSEKSISQALDVYGIDGVEVDLKFTRDGEIVLFHDRFLEMSTDGRGKVEEQSFEEIMQYRYRQEFHNTGKERILSLSKFIELLQSQWVGKHVSFSIDLEPESLAIFSKDSLCRLLVNALESSGVVDQCFVESSDLELLELLKSYNEQIECYWLTSLDEGLLSIADTLMLDGFVFHHLESNKDLQQQLKTLNKGIMLYGQLIQSDYVNQDYTGVTALQVDNPIQALKYFERD